jgi:hypothetical protein
MNIRCRLGKHDFKEVFENKLWHVERCQRVDCKKLRRWLIIETAIAIITDHKLSIEASTYGVKESLNGWLP